MDASIADMQTLLATDDMGVALDPEFRIMNSEV
jgi:hypothetical protein